MLSIRNLYAGYGKIAIVQDFSLDVSKNEVVTVLGPNGSGKSTVFKSIFGLAYVFAGRVFFKNQDITYLRRDLLVRHGMAYVPQLSNIFTSMTVEENLELGGVALGGKVKERIKELYQLFPVLWERRRQKAGVLSGGQRQVLALAKALVSSPELLVLDEPTAGLSPKASLQILNHLKELKKNGLSLVIIEQNVKRALEIADKVCLMAVGRKIFEGRPEELVSNREITKLYLGMT
ncbi:MAG: ABC transporter ATP-binding protein [Candidatus Caldarchaeum sp.]|jgi:ABC-type branched-subunit amino acid transport system ATPase component|nr:ABC transporter ATP-binding protein [Candidatus Caldarchaeales archaeon]